MKTNKVRFSIIIAAYNVETYIEEAIKSVLNQEFCDYELIIVDDCSTDSTYQKIEKYKDGKVKICKTQYNTGTAGGARNEGLKHSEGEYIIFLDGDDRLYNKETLTEIDKLIGQVNYDIIYFGYQDLGGSNKTRISNKQNSTKEARLICDVSFSVSSRCWSRKFLEENKMKFIEGMFYEDEAFCMKGNILAENTTCGEFPIFNYRRNRKGSVMSTPSVKKCSDWYRMLAELVDMYEITPEEYRPYLLSFIKNESENIPLKIKAILKSLKEESGTPVFPKREYKFINVWEEDNE